MEQEDSCGSTGTGGPAKKRRIENSQLLASRIVESSVRTKPKVGRREVCPHCNLLLSTKTLKRHRALFFNNDNGTWITSNCISKIDTTDDVEGMLVY